VFAALPGVELLLSPTIMALICILSTGLANGHLVVGNQQEALQRASISMTEQK